MHLNTRREIITFITQQNIKVCLFVCVPTYFGTSSDFFIFFYSKNEVFCEIRLGE